MINYDILIDMKKSGCIDTGYELSQGDKELVEFNIILKNGSANYIPEGNATIVFKKANNTTQSGALIPDGNKYNYKIKGSELSVPGPVLAEIKTYDSETGRASSSRFKFWVKTDLANYDTTETGTYIGELEHKIIEANALIDQLTQSRDEALVMIEELGVGNFINVNKIVNTTAVTEAGFVPDALLVKTNAEAISTLSNNLASNYLKKKGTDNPLELNLNNYKETARHSIGDAVNYTNIPSQLAGAFSVDNYGAYIVQKYITPVTYHYRMSINSGTSWGGWKALTLT